MTRALIVRAAAPGVSIQDAGRPGFLAFGLSRGGAVDRLALSEGAALLRQSEDLAAIELGEMGGEFEATEDMRIALTGAAMQAAIDGAQIAWNASHMLPSGSTLKIGAAREGRYGYLHVGGGVEVDERLGSRSTHFAAHLGGSVHAGEHLMVGSDAGTSVGQTFDPSPRFSGGTIRVVPSLQTEFFSPDQLKRFQATEFKRDARGNRMGVPLRQDGPGFQSSAGLSVLSEVVIPGDIQITGDGTPFVLLCECQTTGGYPRIASVIPADLPRVAQAPAGAALRFEFVSIDDAVDIEARTKAQAGALPQTLRPLVRDPRDMPDLLAFNLISGATTGTFSSEDST